MNGKRSMNGKELVERFTPLLENMVGFKDLPDEQKKNFIRQMKEEEMDKDLVDLYLDLWLETGIFSTI